MNFLGNVENGPRNRWLHFCDTKELWSQNNPPIRKKKIFLSNQIKNKSETVFDRNIGVQTVEIKVLQLWESPAG